MAGLAHAGALDVGAVLAGGRRSIMTTHTIAGHIGVVKIRRHPGIGCVAIIAGFRTGKMVRCLASGNRAIMTSGAAALGLCMIHPQNGRPGGGDVAGHTQI
jgi:hypothetical protein